VRPHEGRTRLPPPIDPRSDVELIDALNVGDAAAFDGLYHRYRDRVARLALRFTGNHADAMDVLQETFAYLYRKFPGFQLTSSLTTFLYPAVRNLSLELRRKQRRATSSENALIDLPAPHAGAGAGDERAELAAVIASLPTQQREVVLLRFVDDLTIDEIGAALDVPAGTVKSRLHHAIRALQQDPRVRRYFED
jgi:RNA polymerase sigma-70 factor (ECF subfamily)